MVDTTPPMPRRDAAIFIPGLGKHWTEQSLEVVARKIAMAIDLQAKNPGQRFTTEIRYVKLDNGNNRSAEPGDQSSVKVCTITARTGADGPPTPILDLYEMNYRKTVVDAFESAPLLMKILWVFVAVLNNFPRVVAAFSSRQRGKSDSGGASGASGPSASLADEQSQIKEQQRGLPLRDKFQALYVLVIFAVICAYLVWLLIGAVIFFTQTISPSQTSATPARVTAQNATPGAAATSEATGGSTPLGTPGDQAQPGFTEAVGNFVRSVLDVIQLAFLAFTVLGAISRDKLRQLVFDLATDYVCMLNYIDQGEKQSELRAQLNQLTDNLARYSSDEGDLYKRTILLTYSFGSIIALDALFPPTGEPGAEINKVTTLVTIGSPFDLIRTFWPKYFLARVATPEAASRRWINIYAPLDLLGSNFRNDNKAKTPDTCCIFPHQQQVRQLGERILDFLKGAKPSENISYEPLRYSQSPINLITFLTLRALTAHSDYWSPDARQEDDCFRYFIPRLYPDLCEPFEALPS